MYRHIMLPITLDEQVDFFRAQDVAQRLLSEGGRLTLLHVVEPIPTYAEHYIPPDLESKSLAAAKEKLAKIAEELGVKDTALLLGSCGRSIVNWAEENSADCIVITSHRPVFSDVFLGSTAAWVVRHAACAVHVIR